MDTTISGSAPRSRPSTAALDAVRCLDPRERQLMQVAVLGQAGRDTAADRERQLGRALLMFAKALTGGALSPSRG